MPAGAVAIKNFSVENYLKPAASNIKEILKVTLNA